MKVKGPMQAPRQEVTSNNVWDRYLYPLGADGEAASTNALLY